MKKQIIGVILILQFNLHAVNFKISDLTGPINKHPDKEMYSTCLPYLPGSEGTIRTLICEPDNCFINSYIRTIRTHLPRQQISNNWFKILKELYEIQISVKYPER